MNVGKPRPNEDEEEDRGGEYVLDITLPIVQNVEENRFEVRNHDELDSRSQAMLANVI